jgi:putative intracellular protease/amidase
MGLEMRKISNRKVMSEHMADAQALAAQHHEQRDTFKEVHILMVVANPCVHPKLHWPLGFWAAELVHPWVEFTNAGYIVTIASPDGGQVNPDGLSDPRDPSRWSEDDIVSLGFLSSANCTKLLQDTAKLADLDLSKFDALVVCGGQSPMFTFRDNEDLQAAIRTFYQTNKLTALFCHGVSAVVDVKLSNGAYLIAGKSVTGFANIEEEYSDAFVGQQVMPWRLEDTLRERGANYLQAGRFRAFAVRDGNLITGQQQYSGRKVAKMVIDTIGS